MSVLKIKYSHNHKSKTTLIGNKFSINLLTSISVIIFLWLHHLMTERETNFIELSKLPNVKVAKRHNILSIHKYTEYFKQFYKINLFIIITYGIRFHCKIIFNYNTQYLQYL